MHKRVLALKRQIAFYKSSINSEERRIERYNIPVTINKKLRMDELRSRLKDIERKNTNPPKLTMIN